MANWSCPDAELVMSVEMMADREGWLQQRTFGIGGSDMAAVMSEGRYADQTPYDVWMVKTGRAPDKEATEQMEWGIAFEDAIARRFAEDTGVEIQRRGMLRSKRCHQVLVNVDRLTSDGGGLECKNVNGFMKFQEPERDPQHQGWPRDWWWQGVASLAVTGRSHWYLAAVVGGQKMVTRYLDREDPYVIEAMEKIFEVVPQFWLDHVVSDVAPAYELPTPLDEISPDAKVEVAIPGLLWEQRARLAELRSQAKAIKEEIAELGTELKDEAGPAEYLTANGIPVVRVGFADKRRSFKTAAFKKDHPNINLDDYYSRPPGKDRRIYLIGDTASANDD